MRVPFVDLRVTDPELRAELLAAIGGVLDRGDYVLGADVEAFEREFAEYCGARYAVGVSSGTSALSLALRAVGIGPGDEVITVSNSFLSTVSAILLIGAQPVIVDVTDDEGIDVAAVAAAITGRTRAVIPVHLRGQPFDLSELVALAGKHGIAVVEDAAQAQGARVGGRHTGTLGTVGCFSLHPLKNLPGTGDAGIMTTDDADLAGRLAALRNHGLADRGFTVVLGDNARLDSVQAATLRVRLRRLDAANARRREIARRYDEAFADLPMRLPPRVADAASVYHHYVARVPDRPEFLAATHAAGVDVRVHYPVPAHRQPAFAGLVTVAGPLRRTEEQADRIVSIPCHPALTDADVEVVIAAVRGHYAGAGISSTSTRSRTAAISSGVSVAMTTTMNPSGSRSTASTEPQ